MKFALGTTPVDLAKKSVAAYPAFHPLRAGVANFILDIFPQQKIDAGRITNVHRIEASLRTIIQHQTGAVGTMGHSVKFIVPMQFYILI